MKLDHYLNAVEKLQGQDVKIASLRSSLAKNVPQINDKYTSKVIERKQEAHFDLIVASLIAGFANVVTMKIVYISDSGNKHHGTLEEWPIVVLGGCSAKLKIPGRYIQFPSYGTKGHKTIGNWWTSVLNAYADPTKHYGDFEPGLMKNGFNQEGPLPEIMI